MANYCTIPDDFSDYEIHVAADKLPAGVALERKVG